MSVVTEAILPVVSIVASLLNVLQLFLLGEFYLGWVGLALFLLPTFLALFYYLENMFHRENKLLELGLITGTFFNDDILIFYCVSLVFGPFLRWCCSVKLLIYRLSHSGSSSDITDLEQFISATRMIDGIIMTAVQIIWMLYLIAIEVFPIPLFSMETKEVKDFFGNVIEVPVVSSLNLYTSIAVLVRNLAQLWMTNFPRNTTESGSETVVRHVRTGACWSIIQWFTLILFVLTGVMYRLMSYLLLFVHLNIFFMPAAAIILLSFAFHVLLRGLSNKFYVETSKMDVFLTACCCSLVPTPTSRNIRAHNLLQAHTLLTNLLLMISMSLCMFLSTDYSLPIIKRPWQLRYSSTYFFNYCLIVIILLPISLLLYLLFKKTMGEEGERKTMFWSNKRPTCWAVFSGIVSTVLLTVLLFLNLLGRLSSSYCHLDPGLRLHGEVESQPNGIGVSVQCHHNYRPVPAANIYCSWFFGPEGFLHISPAYSQDLVSPQTEDGDVTADRSYIFLREMSGIDCVQKTSPSRSCSRREVCRVDSLLASQVRFGRWVCHGVDCSLFCEVRTKCQELI